MNVDCLIECFLIQSCLKTIFLTIVIFYTMYINMWIYQSLASCLGVIQFEPWL